MPIDNVVEGETILTAWGNDVADTVNALELAPPSHALSSHTGTLGPTGLASDAVTTIKIADDAVTNPKLANMAASTIKGRASGAGTGDPTDLTAAQARTILGVLATSEVAGTSFPGSPSAGARFFRTDLGIEFYWDGTRWLGTTLQHLMLRPQGASLSGGNTQRSGAPKELGTGLGIWLVRATCLFYIESGGSALSASHKWELFVGYEALGTGTNTTLATFTIDSGASTNIVREATAVAIGSKLPDGAMLRYNYTKTGTPGNIWLGPVLEYRLSGS